VICFIGIVPVKVHGEVHSGDGLYVYKYQPEKAVSENTIEKVAKTMFVGLAIQDSNGKVSCDIETIIKYVSIPQWSGCAVVRHSFS